MAAVQPRGIIAIPARLESSRLVRKLLLDASGRPLLAHTIEQALAARAARPDLLSDVIVACDNEKLMNVAERLGVTAVMTGPHHQCGTTRIAEAIELLNAKLSPEFVVNLQGDQPEVASIAVHKVAEALIEDSSAEMATLAVERLSDRQSFTDPHIVKVVFNRSMHALYFSRAPIPYGPTEHSNAVWYHHIGLYVYWTTFLRQFAEWPCSHIEGQEGLEQLRALDQGAKIRVVLIPDEWTGPGINTEDDYARFLTRSTLNSSDKTPR
jgi:3-deoxy-manno-octulosonate cytidylyltransferase (CMP-KDO synthetase)